MSGTRYSADAVPSGSPDLSLSGHCQQGRVTLLDSCPPSGEYRSHSHVFRKGLPSAPAVVHYSHQISPRARAAFFSSTTR